MTAPIVRIADIAPFEGQTVRLQGWMFNRRGSKRFVFMQVRDGSGFIQCVVNREDSEERYETAKRISQESSVVVTGTVAADTRSKLGFEVHVTDVEVVSIAAGEYPIG